MNIIGSNNIYNIPFDQYQRYKTTSLIVEKYRIDNTNLTILEIGANEHKNLEKFLPNDKIRYLDIKLSDELLKDEKYILADATNMPQIKDNSFDVVIALDVFEHIPSNLRKSFLNEINRVSKILVIIAGPFDEPEVTNTEVRVNQYYKNKYGEDYIWLKEHIENKLPNLIENIEYIQNNLNLNVQCFAHGSLEFWEKLMLLHFEVAGDIILQQYRMNIDLFYNQYLFGYDISDINYRQFLIMTNEKKDGINIFDQNITHINEKDLLFFNLFINSIYDISKKNEKLKKEIYFIQIFIEDENGLSEENSIKYSVKQNNEIQKVEFDLKDKNDIKSLRLDPLNDYCIIKINEIRLNNIIYKDFINTNAFFKEDNLYYFNTDDSQIYISLPSDILIDTFSIEIQYLKIGKDTITDISNAFSKIFNEKEQNIQKLNQELENRDKSIENLNQELENRDKSIENLRNEVNEKSKIFKKSF